MNATHVSIAIRFASDCGDFFIFVRVYRRKWLARAYVKIFGEKKSLWPYTYDQSLLNVDKLREAILKQSGHCSAILPNLLNGLIALCPAYIYLMNVLFNA